MAVELNVSVMTTRPLIQLHNHRTVVLHASGKPEHRDTDSGIQPQVPC